MPFFQRGLKIFGKDLILCKYNKANSNEFEFLLPLLTCTCTGFLKSKYNVLKKVMTKQGFLFVPEKWKFDLFKPCHI